MTSHLHSALQCAEHFPWLDCTMTLQCRKGYYSSYQLQMKRWRTQWGRGVRPTFLFVLRLIRLVIIQPDLASSPFPCPAPQWPQLPATLPVNSNVQTPVLFPPMEALSLLVVGCTLCFLLFWALIALNRISGGEWSISNSRGIQNSVSFSSFLFLPLSLSLPLTFFPPFYFFHKCLRSRKGYPWEEMKAKK